MSQPEREPTYIKIVITSDVYKKMEEFKDNWEGQEVVDVAVRVELGNGRSKEVSLTMSEFLEAIGLEEADAEIKPCETCGGNGEVKTSEYDSDSNTYAPTGTENCPDCNLREPDHEPDDEE